MAENAAKSTPCPRHRGTPTRESSEFGVGCSMFDIILRKKTPNIEHRISNFEDVAA
jgi:hypothetical protein